MESDSYRQRLECTQKTMRPVRRESSAHLEGHWVCLYGENLAIEVDDLCVQHAG